MRSARLLPGVLLALLAPGCGDGEDGLACTGSNDPEALRGSFCEGSEIRWDSVELGFLSDPPAVRIRYGVRIEDRVAPRFQIQVLGEVVQLEPGVSIPLSEAGFVQRWPEDAQNPQNLTDRLEPSSSVVFERLELSDGSPIAGAFDLLLTNGRTLRGRFEGALVDLTPN